MLMQHGVGFRGLLLLGQLIQHCTLTWGQELALPDLEPFTCTPLPQLHALRSQCQPPIAKWKMLMGKEIQHPDSVFTTKYLKNCYDHYKTDGTIMVIAFDASVSPSLNASLTHSIPFILPSILLL